MPRRRSEGRRADDREARQQRAPLVNVADVAGGGGEEQVQEPRDSDGLGTLIKLGRFGPEVKSWRYTLSHHPNGMAIEVWPGLVMSMICCD